MCPGRSRAQGCGQERTAESTLSGRAAPEAILAGSAASSCDPLRRAHSPSCSVAAALKVSPATSITCSPAPTSPSELASWHISLAFFRVLGLQAYLHVPQRPARKHKSTMRALQDRLARWNHIQPASVSFSEDVGVCACMGAGVHVCSCAFCLPSCPGSAAATSISGHLQTFHLLLPGLSCQACFNDSRLNRHSSEAA